MRDEVFRNLLTILRDGSQVTLRFEKLRYKICKSHHLDPTAGLIGPLENSRAARHEHTLGLGAIAAIRKPLFDLPQRRTHAVRIGAGYGGPILQVPGASAPTGTISDTILPHPGARWEVSKIGPINTIPLRHFRCSKRH